MVLYHAASTYLILRDFRLPPRNKSDLRYSGILHTVWWHFLTDVSGKPIEPIFLNSWILNLYIIPKRRCGMEHYISLWSFHGVTTQQSVLWQTVTSRCEDFPTFRELRPHHPQDGDGVSFCKRRETFTSWRGCLPGNILLNSRYRLRNIPEECRPCVESCPELGCCQQNWGHEETIFR
jgi:hypothetical protein